MKKFVDCRTRDISKRELYIVEETRHWGPVKWEEMEFQAIMPVRGKF